MRALRDEEPITGVGWLRLHSSSTKQIPKALTSWMVGLVFDFFRIKTLIGNQRWQQQRAHQNCPIFLYSAGSRKYCGLSEPFPGLAQQQQQLAYAQQQQMENKKLPERLRNCWSDSGSHQETYDKQE
jgi:hypothetical protein